MTTLDDAYAHCRAIAHKHGANFSVGFRFLPKDKRRAVYAAYAYCRVADDIADEEDDATSERHPFDASTLPAGASASRADPDLVATRLAESKRRRLDAWEAELDACYHGTPAHPITIAIADSLQRFSIPKSGFLALLQGCRQDMVKTRYETFEELLHYCELVAASISDISLSIFGYRTGAAVEYGRNLSTALQLTNVTRDIGDDLPRDRIYVPAEELRRFGVTEEELFGRVKSDRLRALIEFQIERAEGYFRAAEPLLGELEFDARFPVLLMGGVYSTVLARLRKDPLAAIGERVSLSPARKLLVVGTRLLRPRFL